MIRVLVADDHYLVRQGVRALLDNARGIEVVGEARDGHEALQLAHTLEPDVVVIDISMPELDGIATTAKLQESSSPPGVVILSMYGSSNLVEHALESGALGYLLKRSTARELVGAVRAVHRGERYLGANLYSDRKQFDSRHSSSIASR